MGVVELCLRHPYTKGYYKDDFFVIQDNAEALLGRHFCERYNLVILNIPKHIRNSNINQSFHPDDCDINLLSHSDFFNSLIYKQYYKVFEGLGKVPFEYKIRLDPNVTPVVHPPRRVPLSLQDRLKQQLVAMEQAGIITPVTEPTKWVNCLLIVKKKNGSLRLCLDPRDLNKAILREHFSIPTLDDIIHSFHGKKFFTVIDMSQGFYQVPLDEASSLICTFNTPFGRYRMSFGISSAPEVSQRINMSIFGDVDGVNIIFDDLIVAAENILEHDRILSEVFSKTLKNGVRFNIDKIQYCVGSVKYMSHIVTNQGVSADPEKIAAIRDMLAPQSVADLRRLMGMLAYISKFIPKMADFTEPLRSLLKKNSMFQWSQNHAVALERIKQTIVSLPLLKFFNPKSEIVIQADASSFGLGAYLVHKEGPVAYASRSLTDCERNYAQIEKELLAIVFACNKFDRYIYGQPVTVHSDHRPLESIFKKSVHDTSPRLQRLLLKLLRYQLTVKYVPGKDLYIPDTLSRAPHTNVSRESELESEMAMAVHTLLKALSIPPNRHEDLVQGTLKDPHLVQVINYSQNGWPHTKAEAAKDVQPFWDCRQDITIADGLVLMNNRVIAPVSEHHNLLGKLHAAHQGIDKMKKLAHNYVYWSGIDKERYMLSCGVCLNYRNLPKKETLMPHDIPDRPWESIYLL